MTMQEFLGISFGTPSMSDRLPILRIAMPTSCTLRWTYSTGEVLEEVRTLFHVGSGLTCDVLGLQEDPGIILKIVSANDESNSNKTSYENNTSTY